MSSQENHDQESRGAQEALSKLIAELRIKITEPFATTVFSLLAQEESFATPLIIMRSLQQAFKEIPLELQADLMTDWQNFSTLIFMALLEEIDETTIVSMMLSDNSRADEKNA